MEKAPSSASRAKLAVLDAVAHVPTLWQHYVLKGGLALRYAYRSPRRSHDLDFASIDPISDRITAEKNEQLQAFCDQLDGGLAQVAGNHGFARMAVASKRFSEEIPALLTEVGYAEEEAQAFVHTVEMQVVLSEEVCETARAEVEGIPLHVPTLEDVLAEKLKALIQQPPRDTVRSTDVFDLWFYLTQSDRAIDREKVTNHLQQKSAKWEAILPVTKACFRAPAVRTHAAAGYDDVRAEVPPEAPFPPFEEAFEQVLRFVDRLNLPETDKK